MLLFITVLQCKASFVCYMMCTVTTLTGANDAQDTRTAYTVVKYKKKKSISLVCKSKCECVSGGRKWKRIKQKSINVCSSIQAVSSFRRGRKTTALPWPIKGFLEKAVILLVSALRSSKQNHTSGLKTLRGSTSLQHQHNKFQQYLNFENWNV